MFLALTEDQRMIDESARTFAARRSPLSRVRELRDEGETLGFSRELWKAMAELGWLGIPFAEEQGGAGMGLAELAIVLEALGRNLAPEPFLSTVLLAGHALSLGGTEAQRAEWLPKVIAGDAVVTLAHQEPASRYNYMQVATRAERQGDGWVLNGSKQQVLDGLYADALIIPARTSGEGADRDGITLFLTDADAAGLTLTFQNRVDGRAAALVELDDVAVGPSGVVGKVDAAAALLEAVIDRATVGLCAEMLGGMTAAFERTLDYLKERKQFGAVIGSFQAIKHRAARLFIEIELARSAVMAAARTADEAPDRLPAMASLAKARCSDTYLHVAEEAIQLHGGIGMTDEHDIGFYLKRARAAELTFGDAAWHRDRWATLRGY